MTIGIIEDDRLLSRSLKVVLEKEGYRTLQVYTKKDAGQILQGTEELLLVDIGLPDGNGMELYHTLMKKWNRKIPAIFLTARDEEQEMLKAFDLGAEDYVVKPFSMKVLLKRIEVAFRRNRGEDAGEQILKCRNLTLYPQRKKAVSGENEISLTAKEYQLLEYLMKNQGQVLTKENILEHVWGIDGQYVVDNSVSVLVGRLRKKGLKLRENGRIFRTYLDWDTGWRKSNGSDRNFVVECWDISFGDSCRGGRNVPGSEKRTKPGIKEDIRYCAANDQRKRTPRFF